MQSVPSGHGRGWLTKLEGVFKTSSGLFTLKSTFTISFGHALAAFGLVQNENICALDEPIPFYNRIRLIRLVERASDFFVIDTQHRPVHFSLSTLSLSLASDDFFSVADAQLLIADLFRREDARRFWRWSTPVIWELDPYEIVVICKYT